MTSKPASPPEERRRTVRDALRSALLEGPATARDLSVRVGVRERDVADHLEHLARSLEPKGERLRVEPPACLGCGYVFRDRRRLSRPSSCPRCRATHIGAATFSIVPA